MSLSLHILVADDQPEVTSYLQDYLSGLGHRVGVAGNGIEALTMIASAHREQDSFHLLLVDARMPMLDGISLVRELRRGRDPTDIAFMTGDEGLLPQLDLEAQTLGCLMVIAKPFDVQQLTQLVDFVALRKGSRRAPAPASRPPSAALEPVGGAPAQPAPASDEYMPTSAAQGGTGRQTGEHDRARRANTFYPDASAPPAAAANPVARTPLPLPTTAIPPAPGGPPATGSFRGTTIPIARPPSDPQIVPPRVARPPTDPRAALPPAPGQGQAVPPLPPVPAPVAQPPRGDVRTTSRIGTLEQQRDLRPPTHIGPMQPPRGDVRTTSRVAPPAQPVRPKLPPSIDPNARRTPLPGMAPPLAPALQDPRAARDPRRTSQVMPPEGIPQPLPPPPARQSQPPQPPQRPAPMLDPNDAQSSRIRRTVNGAQQALSQDGNTARMVACASCGNAFRATIKPQAYNVVCVHCGQLNRIDP